MDPWAHMGQGQCDPGPNGPRTMGLGRPKDVPAFSVSPFILRVAVRILENENKLRTFFSFAGDLFSYQQYIGIVRWVAADITSPEPLKRSSA